jgi:ubiquinone/menaquinone biosynthesis C-methylase UbiE
LADNSFDTAAATFVFCSVPDPIRGLRELNRVVRPDGRILLLDHVRIDRPVSRKISRRRRTALRSAIIARQSSCSAGTCT